MIKIVVQKFEGNLDLLNDIEEQLGLKLFHGSSTFSFSLTQAHEKR